jgi:RNA polymerase sigma factor (sigma-70 family)
VARELNGTAMQDLRTLFSVGVTTGLTDGQLLEHFTARPGEVAERAFATLVERHGPMILRACRGILRDDHDVQDAFQATFLILVRSGSSLWVRDSLGPWLHRVACRVAIRSRQASSRRKSAERIAAETAGRAVRRASADDAVGVLHEEIDRLPDRFRIPVVLCDLEGRTYEDAARHLRCPVGTVKSRLARGRKRLRGELSQRGFSPSGAGSAAVLAFRVSAEPSPKAALESASLVVQAVSARVYAARAVPDAVLALSDGVLRSMIIIKWTWTFMLALTMAGVGSGLGWGAQRVALFTQTPEPIFVADQNQEIPMTGQSGGAGIPRAERRTDEEASSPPFDEIRVDGNVRVIISLGPEHHLRVIGGTDRRRQLRTRIESGSKQTRLVLEMPPVGDEPGNEEEPDAERLEIRVTTPRLSGVIAEARSTVEIGRLENNAFALTVSDFAKVSVSGTSVSMTVVLGDDADVDASRLAVEAAKVTASGRSSGVFHPKKSLSVLSSGTARVEYLGNPDRVDKMTSDRSILIPR